jgi:mannose-6-phosphate isomerase-like protein (cupin superfamily)
MISSSTEKCYRNGEEIATRHLNIGNPMIKNFLSSIRQIQESSHGGTGKVDLYEIWGNDDFKSNVDFIDRVVVPPNSTIGFHQHADNEEMYIVLEGSGLMRIEDQERAVTRGDMILNPAGGRHGLFNNSDKDIDLLVLQVSIDAGN